MHFIIKDLHICCDGHEIEELIKDNDGRYYASFEFDEAWDTASKTARFESNRGYVDSLIGNDNRCVVPIDLAQCNDVLTVSVYDCAHNASLVTDTVCVRITTSVITDANYLLPGDPDPNIYTQIANSAADALKIARSVEDRANSGEFNGRDGADAAADNANMDKKADKEEVSYSVSCVQSTTADMNGDWVVDDINKNYSELLLTLYPSNDRSAGSELITLKNFNEDILDFIRIGMLVSISHVDNLLYASNEEPMSLTLIAYKNLSDKLDKVSLGPLTLDNIKVLQKGSVCKLGEVYLAYIESEVEPFTAVSWLVRCKQEYTASSSVITNDIIEEHWTKVRAISASCAINDDEGHHISSHYASKDELIETVNKAVGDINSVLATLVSIEE